MAENKKSIIVYADWIDKFEELEDEEAGRLIKHFFRYVNDLNPEYPDRTTKLMFIDIKATLKRDLTKWEDKSPQRIEKARLAGLASAEARKLKKELNSTNELKAELNPTKSTVSVSVSVSDTTTNNAVIKFEDAVKICLFDENWKEDVERVYKIDRNKIQHALTDFTNHCGTIGEKTDKSLKNFQKHFTNWVRIKKQYAVGLIKMHYKECSTYISVLKNKKVNYGIMISKH